MSSLLDLPTGFFVQKRQALPEYVKKYGDTCPVVQVQQEDLGTG